MRSILVTGAGGLIGSESCRFFLEKGKKVLGIDNNMRRVFFGAEADITPNIRWLKQTFPDFRNYKIDIRDKNEVLNFFNIHGPFDLIIHTAAQPSHDWAAKKPLLDFNVNAYATLNLLEATRQLSPEAVFIFASTNKVYGDNPNQIPLFEGEKRWEYDLLGDFRRPELKIGVTEKGINEKMSLDACVHSIFGVSKTAADLMTQEYGRNFGLKTATFRGGCLTGPQHTAVKLHGFLAYIIQCALNREEYTILGYKGKQVRDQIHSYDVVNAFWNFYQKPKPGEVYNLGGGKQNSASILEIIDILKDDFGLRLSYTYNTKNRVGDHKCYYTDMSKFERDYPDWSLTRSLPKIIDDIIKAKTKQQ